MYILLHKSDLNFEHQRFSTIVLVLYYFTFTITIFSTCTPFFNVNIKTLTNVS